MVDLDRARIARRLARGQSVELDWGLVLTPPKTPGARGAGGSYRWIFYDPPRREDGSLGKRVQRNARQLDDQAWLRLAADLSALVATMVAQATGTRLDATFEQLARHWLDPARHPDWSADYAKKVHSVTTNWLLADTITIATPHRSGRIPAMSLSQVLLGDLTAAIVIEALDHVGTRRAHGTNRAAHECATAIVSWGISIKWLPLGQIDTTDIKRAPDARVGALRGGARGNINPVPKNDIPDVSQLLLPFHRCVGEHHGQGHRILLDLLAFAGPRIGEALATHVDRLSRDDEGNGWLSVEERADRTSKKQAPPKHRKHRDVWIPGWLADDLATIDPNADGYLFGAAQGSTSPVDRWHTRRFDRWARDYGWEQLSDYCSHDDHDADSCRGQNRRRWRHSIHDWRHTAAVWQLFELRLDPEDVAQHLGHGDGYTLYQLYVGARPGRAQRAAKAVEELGDPRAR